jgi:riboflavin kinase / FMN adenylyltransferase
MKSHHTLTDLTSIPGPLHLAIGVFDGLHLGHQEVIRTAQAAATADGGTAVVVTFDPHPIRLFRPEQAPRLLTSTRHKEIILSRLGVQHLLEIPFTREFANHTAEEFVAQLQSASQPLGSISVGVDWAFGKGRRGNVALLKALGTTGNFAVNGVARVCTGHEPISSTRIRSAVEAGDFSTAEHLLGRTYAVLGTIFQDRQIGRKIGFPTANLQGLAEQLPPVGVYAVRASLGGEFLPGVANLGYRPTTEENRTERRLEVHLLDFDEDIYGQQLEVKFIARIRDEMRLNSLEELKAQIAADSQQAREILGQAVSKEEMDLE